MSEEAVWNAAKALLSATPLGEHVYDYGKVPGESGNAGSLPAAFALLSVERRYNGNGTAVTGWRLSVRYVATTAANARKVGQRVRDAFEAAPGHGKRITVGGVTSTPITHESTTAVEPDDGRYSGLSVYTIAL